MIEQIRQKASGLFDGGEDRGVSPVIGVILMVAITVILAAVIGAFVLGLGDDLGSGSGPQMSASTSLDDTTGSEELRITHNNGDSVDPTDLRVVVRDSSDAQIGSYESLDGTNIAGGATGDMFSTGDTLVISVSGDVVAGDDNLEVQVIHEPSSSIIHTASVTGAEDTTV